MCGGARAAYVLQHVNLLLVLFAGAALATGARLRWDPSIYVPVRELLPFEYKVLAVALPLAGAALLALTHLAIAAASRPEQPRRALLYTYAGLMALAIASELALGGWVYSRVVYFTHSPEFEELEQILATREHLRPLLQHLARWHAIPDRVSELIQEAEDDLPWNGYIGAAGVSALMLLQLLGVVFSVLAARPPRSKVKHHVYANGLSASRVSLVDSIRSSLSGRSRTSVPQTPASVRSFRSAGGKSDEWAPLKAKYRNGKIVPV